MSSYIQNYGFTKTLYQNNQNILQNEIKWKGDYNGKIANINVDINDNGNRKNVSMLLDNNDLKHLFGIQPVEIPLEKRLINDFLSDKISTPITLEGILIKGKSRRHKKGRHKRKQTKRVH